MQSAFKILVLVAIGATVISGSPNVPIWELLTHQEKMGRLMYFFTHLVHSYCKGSDIPDCNKVLTIYGMSNLLNEDDLGLNQMNPFQRNSKVIIWERVMRGDFKLTNSKGFYANSVGEEVQSEDDYDYINEVGDRRSSYQVNQRINKLSNDPHPYAVLVPAPDSNVDTHASKVSAASNVVFVTSDFDSVQDNLIQISGIPSAFYTDNNDIVVGSSHPYAVKVLPESISEVHTSEDNQSSSVYEPIMMESKVHETRALPPTLTILTGK